jgi:hypothetical protein
MLLRNIGLVTRGMELAIVLGALTSGAALASPSPHRAPASAPPRSP